MSKTARLVRRTYLVEIVVHFIVGSGCHMVASIPDRVDQTSVICVVEHNLLLVDERA